MSDFLSAATPDAGAAQVVPDIINVAAAESLVEVAVSMTPALPTLTLAQTRTITLTLTLILTLALAPTPPPPPPRLTFTLTLARPQSACE